MRKAVKGTSPITNNSTHWAFFPGSDCSNISLCDAPTLCSFGHIGFLVEDVYQSCNEMKNDGCIFQKEPNAGSMKGLAFVKSPDGIWCEVIQKGGFENSLPYQASG